MRTEGDFCEMVPRIGAFEVSVVLDPKRKRGDIRFYSKVLSLCWPHISELAKRVVTCVETYNASKGKELMNLTAQFETTGIVKKQRRRDVRLESANTPMRPYHIRSSSPTNRRAIKTPVIGGG